MSISKDFLFGNIDVRTIQYDPDFKENSVREVIVHPLLKSLGYQESDIIRDKTLSHPFLRIGSNKNIPIKLIPDYSLKVQGNFAWVLDAKSPDQDINDEKHIEQVYCYATHPEIRSTYFALCNGIYFSLYRRESTNTPILQFSIDEIEYYWDKFNSYLSPDSFQIGKLFTYNTTSATSRPKGEFNYTNRPLLEEIPVHKRAVRRHFGVHGYFTKQSWNVVADYIKNFSKPGDLVLDPFGGSGVTAIEAMMNNRRAISIDINPLAVFIVQSLIEPVDSLKLTDAFKRVVRFYMKHEPGSDESIASSLQRYSYPKGNVLPKSSDVDTIESPSKYSPSPLIFSSDVKKSQISLQK